MAENKPEGAQTITAETINFIAEKFKELKQENAHLIARIEALEKQIGAAVGGAEEDAKKAGKAAKSWLSELFD